MSQVTSNSVWETIRTVIYAVMITVIFRTFLYEPFNIPSGSMKPNLLVGDFLFVSKASYGYSRYSLPLGLPLIPERIFASAPERGDVAVFKHPQKTSVDYIKRIIGLPGDKLQMINGVLHINGQAVQKEALENWVEDAVYAPQSILSYRETLPNGKSYTVIELSGDRGSHDNTKVYTVPEGHYFGMGDNRDNSMDSRFSEVGFIPEENFVGRAEILFFSTNGHAPWWQIWEWPSMIRYSRIFDAIK